MVDLYLQALMKGEVSAKKQTKDRYDLAIEKSLNEYVASLSADEEFMPNALITPAMKKARLKEQARMEFDESWLAPHIAFAFKILKDEAVSHLLEPEKYEAFIEEFSTIESKLEHLDLDASSENNFQTLLNLSNVSMNILWDMAMARYLAEEYKKSLAFFALLAALGSDNQEYWLRVGVLAHKCEDYQLALHGYKNALSMNPDSLEARLLAIECYQQTDQHQAAESELHAAKHIIEEDETEIDSIWLDLFKSLEQDIPK